MRPDRAHKAIDRRLFYLEQRIGREYARLFRQVKAEFLKRSEELKKAEEGLQGAELYEARRRRIVYDTQAQATMKSMARLVTERNAQVLKSLDSENMKIYVLGWNATNNRLRSMGLPFSVIDEGTIRALLKEERNLLPRNRLDRSKDYRWNLRRIRLEFLQGIENGEGIEKLADRLEKVVDSSRSVAVRNARTIATRVENQARNDRFKQDAETLEQYGYRMVKVWISTPDERTRPHHRELNGRTQDANGYFGYGLRYPADPHADPSEVWNCRCSLGFKYIKVKR